MHLRNLVPGRPAHRWTVHNHTRRQYSSNPASHSGGPARTSLWVHTLSLLVLGAAVTGCAGHKTPRSQVVHTPTCERVITADVVALDQVYYYNRFGAFNPAGMMYALRRDVVENFEDGAEPEILNEDLDAPHGETETFISSKPDAQQDLKLAGNVKLRSDKRPRPLVLRANEGDCLEVTFTNLLDPKMNEHEFLVDPERRLTHPETPVLASAESDEPATRHASMHVNGLSLVDSIDSQGANVGRNGWHTKDAQGHTRQTSGQCSSQERDRGLNLCALAAPGETRRYTWYAKKEGTYFMYSMGGPAGGEGDGGQLGLGLFGAINVQPKGANWYRSQVTEQELHAATTGETLFHQPIINYEATIQDGHRKGDPLLNMLKCAADTANSRSDTLGQRHRTVCKEGGELIASDLNAVIDIEREERCEQVGEGNTCGEPYREFTVIFHDELTAVQAFDKIRAEDGVLSSLRDGMGINYGSSGLGALVVANREKIGPARDCAECKLEEFFLTSWVNGDPAMVVGYKKDNDGNLIPVLGDDGQQREVVVTRNGKEDRRPLWQMEAKYPDDPSNVHHSYLGDPVRFRNMHAGPKETHVFHLHAHQWVEDKHDPQSHYLDSQTISPGSAFSYDVHYGGSGNRNFGPGDSIFHCHLYPHFAEGMWELWRTHDVFENGTAERWLPDYDITEGVPSPAIVPLPRIAMPPMPTEQFPGYPFYIAGQKGHRPPQPPLDLEGADSADLSTTLRRHIILKGDVLDGEKAHGPEQMQQPPSPITDLYDEGRQDSAKIATRVANQNRDPDLLLLARELEAIEVKVTDDTGTANEKEAMRFHGGQSTVNAKPAVKPGDQGWHHSPYNWEAPGYVSCLPDGTCDDERGARVLFHVNGGGNVGQDKLTQGRQAGDGVPGAPFSNPCPKEWVDETGKVRPVKVRQYRTVYLQVNLTVNKSGWHDPQARFPVLEEDAKATLDGTRPTEPLFFRAQSGECIEFFATNLIPSNLNLDDFQVYTPTDTIGQHIHLVKFDVTSSDGSGNGWNYEDGTFAADEIRERIVAHNRHLIHNRQPGEVPTLLEPKTHKLFGAKGALKNDKRGICPPAPMTAAPGETNEAWIGRWDEWAKTTLQEHPWCGAQTTIQRWWADPTLNGTPGAPKTKDRTMRTVFTHDHFGPSSHQQHGFYAALVVEPRNSKWYFPDGRLMGGTDEAGNPKHVAGRQDGGPTSYAANIIVRDKGKACVSSEKDGVVCSESLDAKGTVDWKRTGREFNLAFADFAIVYDTDNQPINPPSQREGGLEHPVLPGFTPAPEGISTKDPGTQLINYRNEPIPLRIGAEDSSHNEFRQRSDAKGDLANVFSSEIHKDQHSLNDRIFTETAKDGRHQGDPATPLLRAYEGDHVQIRLIQGAQEEQHIFTLHGGKWLAQPDSKNTGHVGAQTIGISEHFEFNDRAVEVMPFSHEDGNGSQAQPQFDHLYASNAADNFWDGQWGLMRVFNRQDTTPRNLARLPGNTETSHDVLASAFVKDAMDELLDSERLEIQDDDTRSERKPSGRPPQDALEKHCADVGPEFVRAYQVEAWLAKDLLPEGRLIYNQHFGITDPNAILFVDRDDVDQFRSGKRRPEPLILRARAGDCIQVTLTNRIDPTHLQDGREHPDTWSFNMVPPIVPGFSFNQVQSSHRVGLHPQLVDYNLQTSDGAYVGLNQDSTVAPNQSKTYFWYAGELVSRHKKGKVVGIPYEFGAIPLQDMGDVIKHASHGAIGALIIEPQCSRWELSSPTSKAQAIVTHWKTESAPGRRGKASKHQVCPASEPAEDSGQLSRFKEMVLLYQDNLSLKQYGQPMPNLRNGDDSEDSGHKAFNYRTEPLWARLGASPADAPDTMNQFDWSNVLSSTVSHFRCHADFDNGQFCDPETPLFTATAGEQIRFRVVHPGGHPRQHGFTLFGHDWSLYPWQDDSRTMGWNQHNQARVGAAGGIGPGRVLNLMTSAGGDCAVPGDYLYRTQEGFMFGGGLWGIIRVEPAADHWYEIGKPDMVQAETGSSRTPCTLHKQASNEP